MTLGLRLLATRLSASVFTRKVSMRSGDVHTLIALHHGLNTNTISTNTIYTLSPSKAKKVFTGLYDSCHSSKMNSPLGGN